MQQVLVVSNPPHGKVDHDAVADTLGLTLADARLKTGFPGPEVLKASDPDRAAAVAASLRRAGLSITVIDGSELADVPWPTPVSSFRFGPGGLVALLGDVETEVPYANPVVGVYCKPPPDFTGGEAALEGLATLVGGRTGPSVSEAIQWLPVLDLFSGREGGLQRLSIVRGVTDFTGLGDLRGGTDAEDMATTVAECESRFDRLTLDTRLENVRPRRRFLAGDASFDPDLRKMYSFGTLLLRQVLDSISSELRDVTQYEFGARLGYVLSRHGTD